MDKQTRNIVIGVSLVAVLGALVFFGNQYYQKYKDKKLQAEEIRKVRTAMHQLNVYADSVGIDTTEFALAANSDDLVADASGKAAKLLKVLRYGNDVKGLAYRGLKENVDANWPGDVLPSQELVDSLKNNQLFEPYSRLIGHYDRLRTTASDDTLRAVKKTLNFYRWLNRYNLDRFVVVNIPAAELNVYDKSGKKLLPMQVIAGKKDTQTPAFTGHVLDITTYPYWNVPESIATKEILPKVQRNPDFLVSQNLQVVNEQGEEIDASTIDWASMSPDNLPFRFRQSTGCDNSLGVMKFNLDNPFSIYMHDTNARELFSATNDRWKSHGCMRLEKPVELANVLLGEQKFDAGFLNRCMIDQKPRVFKLPKKYPIFVVYNTTDVDASGQLRFYDDVYALSSR